MFVIDVSPCSKFFVPKKVLDPRTVEIPKATPAKTIGKTVSYSDYTIFSKFGESILKRTEWKHYVTLHLRTLIYISRVSMPSLGCCKGPSIASSMIFVRPTRSRDIFRFSVVHGPKFVFGSGNTPYVFFRVNVRADVDTIFTRISH